jgi:hypothetical protein
VKTEISQIWGSDIASQAKDMGKAGLVIYGAVFVVFGVGGLSFQSQPISGYIDSTSNNGCPGGSIWTEGNRLHWCDGSREYNLEDDPGDPVDLVDFSSPAPSGSMWVEGSDLHWVDSDDDEYRYTGDYVTNNGAGDGSLWVENGDLHYIDEFSNEREVDR